MQNRQMQMVESCLHTGGCKGTIGASGLIKNVLETAGLPTMILDGDGCNPANTSDGQVSTRLQAFAEMLEKNKEEKHS